MKTLAEEFRKTIKLTLSHFYRDENYKTVEAASDIIDLMQSYHEVKLKEELENYAKWYRTNKNDVYMDIDEYLNQRNNEKEK